eukprot:TRINITY_DN8110_c0_g1_i1.p1 TRINITY_DN8110_c0_g1~~TRINITY_DN8110_c0_g1_i1.p1  ORF type:complete len:93 (+),score=14.57 TRINITY_DN8110_c0_g1_i1:191-469(+)
MKYYDRLHEEKFDPENFNTYKEEQIDDFIRRLQCTKDESLSIKIYSWCRKLNLEKYYKQLLDQEYEPEIIKSLQKNRLMISSNSFSVRRKKL